MIKYIIMIMLVSCMLVGCATKPSSDDMIHQEEQNQTQVQTGVESVDVYDPALHLSGANFHFDEYIPTLMFHYIQDISPDSSDQLGYRLSFSPKRLEMYLKYFQEQNIQTLTYWDIKAIREGRQKMPKRAVMLTFDDGHADHYTQALPLLEKYGAKGVFFIISGKPDIDPAFATWDQIREIEQAGHEIASHTITHTDLAQAPSHIMQAEIIESKQTIESQITRPIISFCYPAGKYNQAVLDVVDDHYLFARTTHPGKQLNYDERFELPTVRIFPESGMNALRGWFPGE